MAGWAGLGLLIAGWFFVVRNVGDTNLKHTPEKINEFKYAFRDCHERLLAIANSDNRQS